MSGDDACTQAHGLPDRSGVDAGAAAATERIAGTAAEVWTVCREPLHGSMKRCGHANQRLMSTIFLFRSCRMWIGTLLRISSRRVRISLVLM